MLSLLRIDHLLHQAPVALFPSVHQCSNLYLCHFDPFSKFLLKTSLIQYIILRPFSIFVIVFNVEHLRPVLIKQKLDLIGKSIIFREQVDAFRSSCALSDSRRSFIECFVAPHANRKSEKVTPAAWTLQLPQIQEHFRAVPFEYNTMVPARDTSRCTIKYSLIYAKMFVGQKQF